MYRPVNDGRFASMNSQNVSEKFAEGSVGVSCCARKEARYCLAFPEIQPPIALAAGSPASSFNADQAHATA